MFKSATNQKGRSKFFKAVNWLDCEGLEGYKQAYKEGRIYGLIAYPINAIHGKDYLTHKEAFNPDNLMTLEACQAYAKTLNPLIDDCMAFNCILGEYTTMLQIGE